MGRTQSAFGQQESEQRFFRRQCVMRCDVAVVREPTDRRFVKQLVRSLADPSWWCFLGGAYTICWPVLGSVTVARLTRFGLRLRHPRCCEAGRVAAGGEYASFWRHLRSVPDKQGGLSVMIAAAVAALQLWVDDARTPLFQKWLVYSWAA